MCTATKNLAMWSVDRKFHCRMHIYIGLLSDAKQKRSAILQIRQIGLFHTGIQVTFGRMTKHG